MIHHDFNGIPTVVLSDVKQSRSRRSIALDQLRYPNEWQKVAGISGGSQVSPSLPSDSRLF